MAAELVDPGCWDHAPQVRGVTTLSCPWWRLRIFFRSVCVGATLLLSVGPPFPCWGYWGPLSQGQSGTKANYLECGAFQQNPYISTHGLHRQYISAQSSDSSCGRTLDSDIAISSCLGLNVIMGPSGSICLSDWHGPSNTSSSMVRGLQHAPK